jgi:predicted lipid-binding transport protein (Tim44 family)
LAYQELAIGVACMIGPLLGGLVYGLFGFFYTFVGMKYTTQFIYYYF